MFTRAFCNWNKNKQQGWGDGSRAEAHLPPAPNAPQALSQVQPLSTSGGESKPNQKTKRHKKYNYRERTRYRYVSVMCSDKFKEIIYKHIYMNMWRLFQQRQNCSNVVGHLRPKRK